jgi:hypothetical protein
MSINISQNHVSILNIEGEIETQQVFQKRRSLCIKLQGSIRVSQKNLKTHTFRFFKEGNSLRKRASLAKHEES